MVPELANHRDERLAALAARQHGVVTTAQLEELGISLDAALKRTWRGHLHRVHRGVYAVGHPRLSMHGTWMAAVLAIGAGAVLSHRSAAELWGLLPFAAGVSQVTIPADTGRAKRRGIRIHRSRTLTPADRTRRLSIPVTTPTRTLLDLARVTGQQELARARRQAEFLGLALDAGRLDSAGRSHHDRTRTALEQRFLRLCRRHRLPSPEVNARVGRYEADFLWREQRLIVETDGWDAHRGRIAFEQDRRRATALALDGYEVMRVTWRQVQEEPGTVAAAVRARLRATRASARPA
jgi:very-short-patch-repair endonuclease